MYQEVLCIHPLDESTAFLEPIRKIFSNNSIIEANLEAHNAILEKIYNFNYKSLIIFLGHGSKEALKGSSTSDYEFENYIDVNQAKNLFKNHDIFLLSCNSRDFLNAFDSYNSSIGFGNIISSMEEVDIERRFRDLNLENEDVELFKLSFVSAVKQTFIQLITNKIIFKEIPIYLRYFINKEINSVLLSKDLKNRKEIAKLLFEFRDEMIYRVKK
jgi:hypothetical protein